MTTPRFERVRRSQARDVVLGIDYGTSTTKVMCREFGERRGSVVAAPGTDDVLWPSLVAIDDGVLYFGHEAADREDPIPWLKMVLAHGPENEAALRLEESYGIHPHTLATFYLAWVIREARTAVAAALGDVRFTYNVAAPLDNLSDPSIEDRYALAFFRAEQLAADAGQSWRLAEAEQAWDRVLEENPALPAEAERATFVLSEVHAATCEVVRQQRLPDGHYAVLDIGAGTTDISVFLFRASIQRDAINGTIAYFASGVLGQACNAVDHRLIGALSDAGLADTSDVWPRLMRAKQGSRDGSIAVGGIRLDADQVRSLARPISNNIHRRYAEVVIEAYQKERRPENWPAIKLLFIGGGGRFEPFRERVHADFPIYCLRKVDLEELHLGERPNLLVRDQLVELAVPEYLFVVASGLSYHISQIPEEIRPSALEPLPPARRHREATQVFCSCNGLNPDCYLCGGTGRGAGLDDQPAHTPRRATISIADHIHCQFCGNIVSRASFANHLRAHHPDSKLIWREAKTTPHTPVEVETLPAMALSQLLSEWRQARQPGGGVGLPGQLQNLMRSYHEAEGVAERDCENLKQIVRLVRGGRQVTSPYSVILINLHLMALLRLGYLEAFRTAALEANYREQVLPELVRLGSGLWEDADESASDAQLPKLVELSFRLDDAELASELAAPGNESSRHCDWLSELVRLVARKRRGANVPEGVVKSLETVAPNTRDVEANLELLYDAAGVSPSKRS